MTFASTNTLKLITLVSVLSLWHLSRPSCILFLVTLGVTALYLSMSFAESSLFYRRNVAHALFKNESLFFHWLQRKWYVLTVSTIKAIILGIVLLMSILHWSVPIAAAMLADIFILMVLHVFFNEYVSKHVKKEGSHIFARRLSVYANIVIMAPILIIIMFYSAPPTYLDASLAQTMANIEAMILPLNCDVLSMLQYFDAVRESLGWWVMFKASSYFGNTIYLMLGWVVFLLLQTFHIWAFSTLILSTTIAWRSIFAKINRPGGTDAVTVANGNPSKWYQPDHFSLAFFGVIILFLVISLTFSTNENHVETILKDNNESYLSEIVIHIDALANEERTRNIEAMTSFIDAEVNEAFQSVYANIPIYADRQYTWYRDYVSIYHVAKEKASDSWKIWSYFIKKHFGKDEVEYPSLNSTKSYAQKSSDEIQRVLFEDGKFERKIYDLEMKTNEQMQKLLHVSKDRILGAIAEKQVNDIHSKALVDIESINQSIEDTFLHAKNELEKTAAFLTIGQAGVTIVLTKTIMAKLLAKSGVKAVAKTGSFIAAGATGLTVCAPSGPWAIACGAVAGTLTWVGVDFAVSKVDEVLTREVFEAKLQQEIKRNEAIFKKKMNESYLHGINQIFDKLSMTPKRPIDVIHKQFNP